MTYALAIALTARDGCREQVLDLIGELHEIAAGREDCLSSATHQAVDDPNRLWLYETYSSRAYHQEEHLAIPEVQEVLGRLTPLVLTPWESWAGEVVNGDLHA